MDVGKALELFWAEVERSSLRHAAKDADVSYSTAAGWKGGAEPKGATRLALLKWAEKKAAAYDRARPAPLQTRDGAPVGVGQIVRDAKAQTDANLIRLSEISGYAKAVLTMMQAVTDAQARVVASLEPYVVAEEQLDIEPLAPEILAQLKADMIASALARAAQQETPPKKGNRKAR